MQLDNTTLAASSSKQEENMRRLTLKQKLKLKGLFGCQFYKQMQLDNASLALSSPKLIDQRRLAKKRNLLTSAATARVLFKKT